MRRIAFWHEAVVSSRTVEPKWGIAGPGGEAGEGLGTGEAEVGATRVRTNTARTTRSTLGGDGVVADGWASD
jgi:hypothetical protein